MGGRAERAGSTTRTWLGVGEEKKAGEEEAAAESESVAIREVRWAWRRVLRVVEGRPEGEL